jgi:hypothetical protein
MPHPFRQRLDAAVALNATCESCHDDEANEWRGSRHHASDTDPAYRRAFAIEPTAFCRGCHAPESNPTSEPPDAVSHLGVGCVTCHVTEQGQVLAATASRGGSAPHPLRRSAEFAETGACASCHEFRFAMGVGDDDGQHMQTTMREHRRSAGRGQPCAACHMPARQGRRSHAFDEVRDPAWLRANLVATAERRDAGEVVVTLAQPAPGHAFPTGDLFRRLEIGSELRSADGRLLGRDVRYLARHFEMIPGLPGRTLVRDDRVFDRPTAVSMRPSPGSATAPRGVLRWWVTYQRIATVGTGTDPAGALVESEVALHSGKLEP